MPTQIAKLATKTLTEQVTDFAKTIPDGEGWTLNELMRKFPISRPVLNSIALKIGIKRNACWYIVNPKTRAQYAQKH